MTETCDLNIINIVCNFEKFIKRYKITDNTIQKLNEEIANVNWAAIKYNKSGINEIYRKMLSKLQTLIKMNIKTVKVENTLKLLEKSLLRKAKFLENILNLVNKNI
jgi:DNA repair ATPase RecN